MTYNAFPSCRGKYHADAALFPVSQGSFTTVSRNQESRDVMGDEHNNNGTDDLFSRSVSELFEEQVDDSPDSLAVVFNNGGVTYRQLNQRANQIARRLRRLGVTRGSLVGLCMDRAANLIAGLLGILKSGAAYVPLDPEYPERRLAFMISDSGVRLVLSQASTSEKLRPFRGQLRELRLDTELDTWDESPENLEVDLSGDDLAYVMYTSGSTGNPKGVMIPHRGIVRLVRNTGYCDFGPDQTFLLLAPISFDASTFEIWGPLLNGARLAIMRPGTPALDELGSAIRRYGVTTLWLTASLFHLMVDRRPEDLRSLRQLVAGGDVLSPTHVRTALAVLDDGVVINGYGPTESTTFACCYRMAKGYEVAGSIPIGQPISHTFAYVLDERLQPLPPGVPGELFIGGAGLALGYLNQPELTRERFIPNPFSGESSARLYRTGDRVRLRSDRNMEFLGRVDHQVKISGHRIELEEVEATLRLYYQVRQAVAVAADDSSGQKRLVAHLLPSVPGCLDTEALKRFLADRLPSFMIPSAFVEVDEFPLSPNGKVDRIALALTGRADQSKEGRSPRGTDLEESIASTWSKVLDRAVGLDDNFFDLGGDSLQLIEVHSELQETLGSEFSMMDLFEYTTIRTLAGRLSGIGAKSPALALARERGRKQKEVFARQRQARGSCP